MIGASAGLVLIVAVSVAKDWVPVLDVRITLGAPVTGALVGLVSGVYPSLRAAFIEPVEALSGGT